jgi:hypothetical protein
VQLFHHRKRDCFMASRIKNDLLFLDFFNFMFFLFHNFHVFLIVYKNRMNILLFNT